MESSTFCRNLRRNIFFVMLWQKTTSELSVQLDFGQNSYKFALVPTRDNTPIFSEEKCFPKYRLSSANVKKYLVIVIKYYVA